MILLQILIGEVLCFVKERKTVGRHWKSVDLNDLFCIFTAHLTELKQSFTTVLYSQWDQLAQFAMPLHLDTRFLTVERQKGRISDSINGMKKLFP